MELHELLNKIDLAVSEMAKLTRAATDLARSQFNSDGLDDEWTRLPKANLRCPVSGLSRSTIVGMIKRKVIRKKTVQSLAYYSAADWRKHLADG